MPSLDAAAPRRRPHIIVLGNEKGGSGKSTTAMHLIVALLRAGAKVASLDLDARQGTLTRYVENRRAGAAELDLPQHLALLASRLDSAVMAAPMTAPGSPRRWASSLASTSSSSTRRAATPASRASPIPMPIRW
jgi:Mrp family chromosome partitioning ATPase